MVSFGLAKQGRTTKAMTLFRFEFWREQGEATQSSRSGAVILLIKKTMWYEEERRGGRVWVYIPIHPAKPTARYPKHVLPRIELAATRALHQITMTMIWKLKTTNAARAHVFFLAVFLVGGKP